MPDHYRSATRTLLRFAIVMAIVGLLSGVLYQESGKRLEFDAADHGPEFGDTRRSAGHG